MEELQSRVGDALPSEVEGRHLKGKGLAEVSHRLMQSKVRETLSVRNGVLAADRHMGFNQLMHLRYSDGAQMLTVGGIFVAASDDHKFELCGFGELPFVRTGGEAYEIEIPCLTLKEMGYLNAKLPFGLPPEALQIPGVSEAEIQKYAKLYRYFPTFAEAVLY